MSPQDVPENLPVPAPQSSVPVQAARADLEAFEDLMFQVLEAWGLRTDNIIVAAKQYVPAAYDDMTHRLVPESVPQYERLDTEGWNHPEGRDRRPAPALHRCGERRSCRTPRAAVRQHGL